MGGRNIYQLPRDRGKKKKAQFTKDQEVLPDCVREGHDGGPVGPERTSSGTREWGGNSWEGHSRLSNVQKVKENRERGRGREVAAEKEGSVAMCPCSEKKGLALTQGADNRRWGKKEGR